MDEKTSNTANSLKSKIGKINFKTLSIEILIILLGTFITALGFRLFLTPHNIVPGGFMGLAQIVYDLLAQINFTGISVSLWYIILNIFLYLYAVKCLGLKFAIRAGVGIFSYSLFAGLISKMDLIAVINNQFEVEKAALDGIGVYILYAIYGGVLMGAGLGLVFRGNGSTGGCDMVAVVLNKFFPTITTGQIVMCVDGAVVVLSAIAYKSLVLPLYALITIFICGKVSDMFVDGVRSLRAFYIITDKKEEISQKVFEKIHRGVTNIKCEGMYTHHDRDMLLVIVRRAQVMMLKKLVKDVDPNSFMFSDNVKEVYGKGFMTYSQPKHPKKNTHSIESLQQANNLSENNNIANNTEVNLIQEENQTLQNSKQIEIEVQDQTNDTKLETKKVAKRKTSKKTITSKN